MRDIRQARSIGMALLLVLVAAAFLTVTSGFPDDAHTSKPFFGKAVNGGTVTHTTQGGRQVLTLSEDFKVPGSPDPHWQVIDSKGNVYRLEKLTVKSDKGDKVNKTITLPSYVSDVAKVQMWCAWAEVLLGEAPFDSPVK